MNNRIDTNTGALHINGTILTPDMRHFSDYEELAKQGLVAIHRRDETRGHVTFLQTVESNALEAELTVFIHEEDESLFRISISPCKGDDFLMTSKQWLDGMISGCCLDDGRAAIRLSYSWGNIGIACVPDPRNGFLTGGDINIIYSSIQKSSGDFNNGIINMDEASLVVWNKALSLGMSHDIFASDFADHITRTKSFKDESGEEYVYVTLGTTPVYDIPADIQVCFDAGTAKKIMVNFDASATKIDSLSTGIKLYQEKVQQTAKNIKKTVAKQFEEQNNSDYLFRYFKGDNELYSVVDDREWLHCGLVLQRVKMENKIDTNTGNIYIHGVVITPDMRKISDYFEYAAKDIVSIICTGEGQAVITFLEPVKSNGVKAKVKIFIDEALQYFSIHITPRNVDDFLRGSKKWLEGMIDDYMADEPDSPISLSYPWGVIGAIYVPNPHSGISGGEISIRYKHK